MNNFSDKARKAELVIKLSEFEIPPMQDVLLVGKNAPIGPEAARRMVDALSPEQYEIIRVDHDLIEALVVRKALLNLIPKEKLAEILLDEGSKVISRTSVIKAQVDISIIVNRVVDL